MSARDESWRSPQSRCWLLVAIVLIGLVLRIWYASAGLQEDRFFDERYSLRNIRSIVEQGTLAPANSFYPYPLFNVPPALLVAASDAIHRWTGDERFIALTDPASGEVRD